MKRLSWVPTALLAAPLAAIVYLWFTFASPYGYQRPADLEPIAPGEHAVFVYGTLRYGVVRWLVYGRWGDPEPGVLDDHQRDGLDVEPQPGARVPGLVLTVDAEELAQLDRYEHLGVRYRRIQTTLADGRRVWLYDRLTPPES
ncbi:gamma-glutamylcyclotransferase family protein [Modicisalibacter coralii]|uniref:gamma-glutamylcyclotransferase family protein n=1 Tax=Modicisalibacter coralii TaxID=2304602 RepID=UPI00100AC34B|nr:gamma-glutamylcyclotransferase family protein [Halomonas coralii]